MEPINSHEVLKIIADMESKKTQDIVANNVEVIDRIIYNLCELSIQSITLWAQGSREFGNSALTVMNHAGRIRDMMMDMREKISKDRNEVLDMATSQILRTIASVSVP